VAGSYPRASNAQPAVKGTAGGSFDEIVAEISEEAPCPAGWLDDQNDQPDCRSRLRNFHFATQCQQPGGKSAFSALRMYQLALILLKTVTAFQADNEGSIPFTRSNIFNELV
jgi:hypothetical protein